MAKRIMIQGTMSNVGKSVLAAGLCRIFARDGYRTSPFKSQNMALNSFITEEGLEMGRAQVMQAEAAGIRPMACMNPILLKPTSDSGSQVILRGKAQGILSASEYYRRKKEYIPVILDAYHTLEEEYEIIVIEGAGSPAEINLNQEDIVNMGLAKMVDAPVILVGDIDRGGVFAQLIGTVMLLEPEERKRICGIVINKFRGDLEILKPGLLMLEERTGIPVLGVVPYFYLDLEDEDSLTERFGRIKPEAALDIVVIRLPRISNFTDFMALECMEEVSVRYVASPEAFGEPDAVILPGSKNTIEDLLWMRQNGLEAKVLWHAARGKLVFGICGGFQMLGEEISDPEGAEQKGFVRGMGLLPVRTVFSQEKTTRRVRGRFNHISGLLSHLGGIEAEGYEIHMGDTELSGNAAPLLVKGDIPTGAAGSHLVRENVPQEPDGAVLGNVCGCYMHGIFDCPEVSAAVVRILMEQKGLYARHVRKVSLARHKEAQYDRLAEILRESLDMEAIYRIIGMR